MQVRIGSDRATIVEGHFFYRVVMEMVENKLGTGLEISGEGCPGRCFETKLTHCISLGLRGLSWVSKSASDFSADV